MTKRLYYDDSYRTEFEAELVEQYRKGDRFAVILDQTAFYPTSGGQQHDRGWLNHVPVLEVTEQRGEVLHLVPEPLSDTHVHGELNWDRRFDFMQQHTAFHILAQSFLRELRTETLSSHLGEKRDTIDLARSAISWEEVERVEALANRIIVENRPVRSFWVSRKELLQFQGLRKVPEIRDKPIRLVEIEDFDLDPCGGTHVHSTGEVGGIKVLSWEKVRGNVRLTFVAGRRALREFQQRVRTVQRLEQVLSATEAEIIPKVEALRQQLKEREKELKKLREERLELLAERLSQEEPSRETGICFRELPGLDPQELKFLALKLARRIPGLIFLYTVAPVRHAVLTRSEGLAVDLREWQAELLHLLHAKGGGGESFLQLAEIEPEALSQARSWLEKRSAEALSG